METVFCNNLKKLRTAAGLTQNEFSERLNVHLQTVSKWERGISEPDISQYGNIADTLDVSIEELFDLPRPERPQTGAFDAERLGRALSALRRSAREEQKDIAAVADVSVDTVSKWERAVICPSMAKLITLARHFDRSLSALYYGENAPAAPKPDAKAPAPAERRRPRLGFLSYCIFLALAIIANVIIISRFAALPAPASSSVSTSVPAPAPSPVPSPAPSPAAQPLAAPQNVRVLDGVVLWEGIESASAYEVRIDDGTPVVVYNKNVFDLSRVLGGEREVKICVRALCEDQDRNSPWSGQITYTYKKPHEHDWGEVRITTPAGEHKAGAGRRSCTVCGEVSTVTLPATAHSYTPTVHPATCTADGYTEHVCSCGDSYKTDIVPAPGHDVEITPAIPATCTEHGKTEGRRCKVCRTVLALSEQTPVLGHDFNGEKCTRCGADATKPTADELFDFALTKQGTYSARPANKAALAGELVIPREHDGTPVTQLEGFEGCKAITSLVFYPDIKMMGFACFRDCNALESVYFMGTLEQWLDIDMTEGALYTSYDLYINGELLTDVVIPDGTTTVKACAFNNCRSITKVTIADSVTDIGNETFASCTGLLGIYIPYSVITIGAYAMPGGQITIYCEAPYKPAGWDDNWNWASSPVVWACTSDCAFFAD